MDDNHEKLIFLHKSTKFTSCGHGYFHTWRRYGWFVLHVDSRFLAGTYVSLSLHLLNPSTNPILIINATYYIYIHTFQKLTLIINYQFFLFIIFKSILFFERKKHQEIGFMDWTSYRLIVSVTLPPTFKKNWLMSIQKKERNFWLERDI